MYGIWIILLLYKPVFTCTPLQHENWGLYCGHLKEYMVSFHKSKCYTLIDDLMNWKEARERCVARGGMLWKMDDNGLGKLVTDNVFCDVTSNSSEGHSPLRHIVWAGATLTNRSMKNWIDGSPILLDYWDYLQKGYSMILHFLFDRNTCMAVRVTDQLFIATDVYWEEEDCSASFSAICEHDIQNISITDARTRTSPVAPGLATELPSITETSYNLSELNSTLLKPFAEQSNALSSDPSNTTEGLRTTFPKLDTISEPLIKTSNLSNIPLALLATFPELALISILSTSNNDSNTVPHLQTIFPELAMLSEVFATSPDLSKLLSGLATTFPEFASLSTLLTSSSDTSNITSRLLDIFPKLGYAVYLFGTSPDLSNITLGLRTIFPKLDTLLELFASPSDLSNIPSEVINIFPKLATLSELYATSSNLSNITSGILDTFPELASLSQLITLSSDISNTRAG